MGAIEDSCTRDEDDGYVPVCHLPYASDYEDSIDSPRENVPIIAGSITIDQIGLVYPEIQINEDEKRENILFRERMEKKKLDKKRQKEHQSQKIINKMLNLIKNKTKKLKIRKTKKSSKKLEAGESRVTFNKIKQFRFNKKKMSFGRV